ncbi:MAG: UDP-N-acetylmuramoyl-L-alanine--D-glutamate ligase [Myxococcales bacterium]|nr:UDP-N-acetylmuramoyl-L-alanine--D-glutamate ligase [Myxococcales bacterium]
MQRSIDGKRVAVIGFGRSGAAAAKLAMKMGAREVVMQDKRDAVELGDDKVLELARDGIRPELGGHKAQTLLESDVIVLSPGVPKLEAVDAAEKAGVDVVSEIEFASWFIKGEYIAVTGTNGKSTVTTLIGEIVKASGVPTFVGGNLGMPLSEAVGTPAAEDGGALVVELSSYQLERTKTVPFRVAVLLNVTPDHLDRYGTLAAYASAKQRIFLSQTSRDFAVVPATDPAMVAMASAGGAPVQTYGGPQGDVRVDGDSIVDRWGARYPRSLLKIRGSHNVENAMAAVLAARLLGAGESAVREGLEKFEGLPHRMQFVAEEDGISYFNDSKATNVAAAVKALEGVEPGRRVVLVAGGRDKGGSYGPMRPLLEKKGRALVLVGEATELMKAQLEDLVPVRHADDMFDAVRIARGCARKGDVVLLAPACSSLDMFENYEERGRVFSAAVKALVGTSRQEEDL